MRPQVDAVVVGSGHNGLVAAAYLAKAGWGVEVLEANPAPGGAVATEDLTLPGYHHDTFSSWHPLFHLSAAYAELGQDLAGRGLAYANADDIVTAAVGEDRPPVVLHRDQNRTAAGLGEQDGATYIEDLGAFSTHGAAIGRLMGSELRSWETLSQVARLGARLGWRASLDVGAQAVASARAWLREGYRTSAAEDLLSPWILHTGLTPDDAGGQLQLRALASALHQVGLPVVRGGSANFVDALVRLIEDHGGRVRTGVEVDRVLVEGGRAVGVRTGAGELGASRAVIANVTPTQLYHHLLPGEVVPPRALRQAGRYRYNRRAGAQIHLALSEPARWREDSRLDHT
ncbi:MAG TPA: NAD(P)/FAD-dependent oxidoreductase, partial [Acidimicrobiales bacterium]|nr:NAD(P)/FAD-dependent oxidoreductase [Acidimicrobiales bacterium]